MKTFKRVLFLLLVITMPFLFGGQANTTVDMLYTWTAPTTGSAVDFYKVYQKVGNGNWVMIGTTYTTSYYVPCVLNEVNLVRVSGVDILLREGAPSEPSDPNRPYVSSVPPDPIMPDEPIGTVASGCWVGRVFN